MGGGEGQTKAPQRQMSAVATGLPMALCRPRWRWKLGQSLLTSEGSSRPMSNSRRRTPPPPPPHRRGIARRLGVGGGAELLALRRAEFCGAGGVALSPVTS